MSLYLPAGSFGIFLLLFTAVVCLFVWRLTPSKIRPTYTFYILHLASLIFALVFVFSGLKHSEPYFVEIGQFYPLGNTDAPADQTAPTLSVGDAAQQPDYILDKDCDDLTCFSGRIDFRLEQKAQGPNILKWEIIGPGSGRLRIFQPYDNVLGRAYDKIRGGVGLGRGYVGGAGQLELTGQLNNLSLIWEPPTGASARAPLELGIIIELNPQNGAPRIVVEHAEPRIVKLPAAGKGGVEETEQADLPQVVYLTSASQSIALRTAKQDSYVPTIKVGSTDTQSNVNALLTPPQFAEGDDFIINDGLSRTGYPFGERVYIGVQRGIVATAGTGGGGAQIGSYVVACLILWLLPLWFFRSIVSEVKLFALVPAVQMLLAVRFVLGLRAYLWSPYNTEAIESAVFALLLVPLLMYIGCHMVGLKNIGTVREQGRSWSLFKEFRPASYYVIAVILCPTLFWLLRGTPAPFLSTDNLAFHGWGKLVKYCAVLIFIPLAICFITLLIDYWLRRGKGRDTRYTSNPDDPISYLITKSHEPIHDDQPWAWRYAIPIGMTVLWGVVVFVFARVIGSVGNARWQALVTLIIGVAALFWRFLFRRVSSRMKPVSHLLSVAAQNFARLLLAVGVLLIAKGIWNLLIFRTLSSTRAVPESLFPLIPIRTATAFEFLILVLTMRLLAVFFDRWSDANTDFGWRGVGEAVIVFFTPLLMFIVSLLASNDTGALLVHGPALIGATLLITGLWSLWKVAAGRWEALSVILLTLLVLGSYYAFAFSKATTLMPLTNEHSTIIHRALLLEGTETAAQTAETGGRSLIGAIEQQWRMLNYASEGRWRGRGFGNAPVTGSRTFHYITLDDLAFSVYVLSEHGILGGWGLLSLYLLLFLLIVHMLWSRLRHEPLRLAFAGALALMLVFPALYMAAANVNEVIFTGQVLPLLGLRSLSDVMRAGLILMLLMACLEPTTVFKEEESDHPAPSWWKLSTQGFALLGHNRQRKQQRLTKLKYNPWTSSAATATNIALVVLLLIAVASFPFIGVARAGTDEFYRNDFSLEDLEERAGSLIENKHIWYEPISENTAAGEHCQGGPVKNTAAPAEAEPTRAYQLCIDDDVRGAAKDDTFAQLVLEWDKRSGARGNLLDKKNDSGQFFQLDLSRIPGQTGATPNDRRAAPLSVNPYKYQWRSPFRSPAGWTGALTESEVETGDGGVLVGAGVVIPLRAAPLGETPVFVGTDPGYVDVRLGSAQVLRPARGFAVYEPQGRKPIFKIETVSGAQGALLRPEGGDFDLFLNGCPLVINESDKCKLLEERVGAGVEKGTAPKVRLDDGDVIAYASTDANGKRTPKEIFVYSYAQLGAYSYIAWVDGKRRRYYLQGDTWPMARQISTAIDASMSGEAASKNVALTVNADLNRKVYDLLRKWRACLDGNSPPKSSCREHKTPLPVAGSSRNMAVTLMDTDTGALLALASDYGTTYDPNDPNQSGSSSAEQPNLNLTRHRVGSAIKPFTAAATLKAFPDLRQLTIVDRRSDKKQILGLPLGGKNKEIVGYRNEITWQEFLPPSDNLYAVTLALLGLSNSEQARALPRFTRSGLTPGAPRLELLDSGSSLGLPDWGNMFDVKNNRVELLEQTPLARGLDDLFDVRASTPPQASSFDNTMWMPLKGVGLMSKGQPYNNVSPEITNFAFEDINNFVDLRSVLLGGEFSDLPQYGRVGAAWSNVYLAQAFTRITTGRKISARIVAEQAPSSKLSGPTVEEWFPNAYASAWRRDLLRGLEGVVVEPRGTAHGALWNVLREIGGSRPQYVLGSGQVHFTVFSKTGTLALGERGNRLEDSIYVFTVGLWNDRTGTFDRAVTGAIYFEQGSQGKAQAFAAELITLLDRQARFNWSGRR